MMWCNSRTDITVSSITAVDDDDYHYYYYYFVVVGGGDDDDDVDVAVVFQRTCRA